MSNQYNLWSYVHNCPTAIVFINPNLGHWKWYEYKSNGIMTLHNDLFRIRYIIEPLINQLCGDLELKHILGCLLSDSNQNRFWVGQVTGDGKSIKSEACSSKFLL